MAPSVGIWDTHIHLLHPAHYSDRRTYTPPAATAASLLAASPANNFLLVEATVQHDERCLLEQMSQLQSTEETRLLRAAILHDINESLAPQRATVLHHAGVRCLRIHNMFRATLSTAVEEIVRFLRGPTVALISQYRWAVAMRLPLRDWSELKHALEERPPAVFVIAEHCGEVEWPLLDCVKPAFNDLLDMLRQKPFLAQPFLVGRVVWEDEPGANSNDDGDQSFQDDLYGHACKLPIFNMPAMIPAARISAKVLESIRPLSRSAMPTPSPRLRYQPESKCIARGHKSSSTTRFGRIGPQAIRQKNGQRPCSWMR